MRYFLAIRDEDGEFCHCEVQNLVYQYVRELEEVVRTPRLGRVLVERYPERFHQLGRHTIETEKRDDS